MRMGGRIEANHLYRMSHAGKEALMEILIVEDSATQAEQLKHTLQQHGYAVCETRDGVAALARLHERKPLLVITDINMPGMDGYELCRRIRGDAALADLPVILLTSLSDPEDVVLGLECGADNFVTKPLDEEYLLSRIRYIMANRHLRSLESTRISLEISLGGRKHLITADRLQMLHLLLSTYESAVLRSKQLLRAQEELRRLNESLEEKVRERTAALTAEIAERRASEQRFSMIFHSSPVAKGFGTLDGRFLDVNEQFCEFFGHAREELLDRTLAELHLWANPGDRAFVDEKLRDRKPLRNHEIRFRRKSGEVRTALLSVDTLEFGDKPVFLATIVDITDRKELEVQIQRLERMESVGRLASGIAHDMNNILAPIMMGAPLLRMGLPPEEMEKTLATIETSAQRGAALVRQLTIFGRGVEGERRPVGLRDIIAEVAKIARQTFPKNIVIAGRVPPDVWLVHGDATQLHQVLLNLCVNARDAMPGGGALNISAENVDIDTHYAVLHPDAKPGKYVLMRVTDTGAGIPPEIVDRIFDPFFTTKELGKGTGLGLSTTLGIVKSHGGFVRLHTQMGRGTTFEVHLPASLGVDEGSRPEPAALPSMRGNGELILAVDDEEAIRAVLRETLERHDYKVLTAQDGVEATAVFAANPGIRLVVTDVDMPLMDGINLVRVLRRMNPAVKVVISTGLADRGVAERRRKEMDTLGVNAVLAKPHTAENLLRAVRAALTDQESSG